MSFTFLFVHGGYIRIQFIRAYLPPIFGAQGDLVPFLPAIAHESETSTATKFEMARPIFPWKYFLLFLALCNL